MNSEYGSLDVRLLYTPASGLSVLLQTNLLGVRSFFEIDDERIPLEISVEIKSVFDVVWSYTIATLIGGEIVDQSDFPALPGALADYDMRIFFSNARISVYASNKWIYSYNMLSIAYPSTQDLSLKAVGEGVTLLNVRRVEIADAREAVYVDYESNSDNAIASVIQERPIENLSAIERAAEFTYSAVKDEVLLGKASSYEDTVSDNPQTSSDGLVYSMDVGISIDPWVAKHLGFITRLYRLPELDSGVERAVGSLQKRGRQSRSKVTIQHRINPLLEVSDIYVMDGTIVTGTSRVINDRVVVEDIGININDGSYRQTTSGRRDVDAL